MKICLSEVDKKIYNDGSLNTQTAHQSLKLLDLLPVK